MDKRHQIPLWNAELREIEEKQFREVDNELFKQYQKALKQLKAETKQYIEDFDELSWSEKQQVGRNLRAAKKINDILARLEKESVPTVENYIRKSVEQGYYGTMYELENIKNVTMDFEGVDEDYVRSLVEEKVAGKNLSKRLYDQRIKLADRMTSELIQGAITGAGYGKVAKRIAELTEADYKQALRIARTEGGRVQSTAKQRAYVEAKNDGTTIEKMWLATLDDRTRDAHGALDGQLVDVEDPFVFDGHKADGPRLFHVAALDINCRCTTVAIIDGIMPDVRRNTTSGEMESFETYDKWFKRREAERRQFEGLEPDYSDSEIELSDAIKGQMKNGHEIFYQKMLYDAPEAVRKAWAKHEFKMKMISDPDTYADGAHYSVNSNGVSMNTNVDIKGKAYQLPGNVFFHEFGHNLDHVSTEMPKMGVSEVYLKNNKNLGQTVYDEINKAIKDAPGERTASKRQNLKEILQVEYDKDNARMASISDLFGGATNNIMNLGVGHEKAYWKPPQMKSFKWPVKPKPYKESMLGAEVFAEMFAATAMDPVEVEVFKKYLPKTYEMFEEILEDIGKDW